MASSFTLFPNDFNIGKDVSGQILDDTGASRSFIQIGHLLQLSIVQHERLVKSTPITNGGIPLIETIWEDGEIHLMFERARGNLEFMVMQAAANFFYLDLRPNFTVNWFVQNKDGTQDSTRRERTQLLTQHAAGRPGEVPHARSQVQPY